jgi:hypothetical protein
MFLVIVFGFAVFTVLAIGFLLLLSRSSAEGALLEEVTQQVRGGAVSSPVCGAQSAPIRWPSLSRSSVDSSHPNLTRKLCVG